MDRKITSRKLAELLGKRHSSLVKLISKIFNEESLEKIKSNTKGRPSEAYLLDLNQVNLILAIGRFETSDKINLIEKLMIALKKDSIIEFLQSIDCMELDKEHYIYIARQVESGNFKIGISKDPARRVKQLSTSSPEKVELIFAYKANEPFRVSETIAHKMFSSTRLNGEWFSPETDVKKLINMNCDV